VSILAILRDHPSAETAAARPPVRSYVDSANAIEYPLGTPLQVRPRTSAVMQHFVDPTMVGHSGHDDVACPNRRAVAWPLHPGLPGTDEKGKGLAHVACRWAIRSTIVSVLAVFFHHLAGCPVSNCEHPAAAVPRMLSAMKSVALHEFIALHREEIIRRCRAKVATRSMPPPTEAEIRHGVPLFLDQMVDALRLGLRSSPQIERSAVLHGHELLLQGFTVSQVVQDYGDVCQMVTGLAVEMNAAISPDDFRSLDLCLDEAIAGALTEYGFGRNQSTFEGESTRGSERLGFLPHQDRDLADAPMQAFEVLRTGNVGRTGATASVLQSTLTTMRALMERSLAGD
jgi:hypothetical protein